MLLFTFERKRITRMNYIKIRYVVSVMITFPLTMSGMMTQQLRKKAVVLQQRLFFKNNNDFYNLIDDPQFSLADAGEMIAKEVCAAGDTLCRSDISHVQTQIVATAIKHRNVTTLLHPLFPRIVRYNNVLNHYSADEHYAYLLAEFHRQIQGKVCDCKNWKKNKSWRITDQYHLNCMSDELKSFDETWVRE